MRMIDVRNTIPKHPNKKWKQRSKASLIILHTAPFLHYSTVAQTAVAFGLPTIPFHDFIDPVGVVYHCNYYQDIVRHIFFYSGKSIAVGISKKNTLEQILSLEKHLTTLCLYLKILPEAILGHSELGWLSHIDPYCLNLNCLRETCPNFEGAHLDTIRANVSMRLQRRLMIEQLYKGPIYTQLTQEGIDALYSFDPRKAK